jgi:hypothetical protein
MLDVPCPACAAVPVTCMLPTRSGAYCRCNACGKMWHAEGVAATGRAFEQHPARRQSDTTGRVSAREVRSLAHRVARLEWELAALRQSATFFADLAERLNAQLRSDRQRQPES